MDKLVSFPENFKSHMTLGQQAFEQAKYFEAKEHFEAAYELEDSLKANTSLVKTLLQLEAHDEAKKIALEKLANYLASEELLAYWLEILLKEKSLQTVKRYIHVFAKNTEFKTKWLAKEALLEQFVSEFEYSKIKSTQAFLQHVPKAYETKNFIQQLDCLPTTQYLYEIKRILVDETYSLLLRNTLLHHLKQLEVTDPIKRLTIEGTIETVTPALLSDHGQEVTYQAIMQQLVAVTHLLDQTSAQQIVGLQKQYLRLLYPYVDKIKEVNQWLEICLYPYKDILPLTIEWQDKESLGQTDEAACFQTIIKNSHNR